MHASSHDGTCAIQPGTGVRKLHSTRRDAFRNVNSQPLAYVSIDGGNPTIVMDSVYQQELDSSNAEITTSPRKYSENVRIAQFMLDLIFMKMRLKQLLLTARRLS